jgi:hypothetical protein
LQIDILNVEVSDVKKYRCDGIINGVRQIFYLQLDLIGRCNYILVIFNVVKQRVSAALAIILLKLSSLSMFQLRSSLLNAHCRTASSPCTTYTGVGLFISLVQ